jgi:hypothetical protein
MKYYLIIGYQIVEKNITYPNTDPPTVNVSINDILIDKFLCDNEESVAVESFTNELMTEFGPAHKKIQNRSDKVTYFTPSKLQIFEIDSAMFNEGDDVLKLEVTKNFSDYTNGFLNKRSMVALSPVFLMPKDLLHNHHLMNKLIKKFCRVMGKMPGTALNTRKYQSTERVVWPGYHLYPDHIIYRENPDVVPLVNGGNFKISLNIKKRLGLHFITHHNEVPKGYFWSDDFFLAWYQWQSKKTFSVDTTLYHDADERRNPKGSSETAVDITVKNNINNANEDK